jgi:hypothetical protein
VVPVTITQALSTLQLLVITDQTGNPADPEVKIAEGNRQRIQNSKMQLLIGREKRSVIGKERRSDKNKKKGNLKRNVKERRNANSEKKIVKERRKKSVKKRETESLRRKRKLKEVKEKGRVEVELEKEIRKVNQKKVEESAKEVEVTEESKPVSLIVVVIEAMKKVAEINHSKNLIQNVEVMISLIQQPSREEKRKMIEKQAVIDKKMIRSRIIKTGQLAAEHKSPIHLQEISEEMMKDQSSKQLKLYNRL